MISRGNIAKPHRPNICRYSHGQSVQTLPPAIEHRNNSRVKKKIIIHTKTAVLTGSEASTLPFERVSLCLAIRSIDFLWLLYTTVLRTNGFKNLNVCPRLFRLQTMKEETTSTVLFERGEYSQNVHAFGHAKRNIYIFTSDASYKRTLLTLTV